MKLLALDTSAEACSVALYTDAGLDGRFQVEPRGHTRLIMPMVRELLSAHGLAATELDALGFACGPGSFTGLRIATGVIQGLAWGLDVPVVPVSSLAAVALRVIEDGTVAEGDGVAIAFDARMDEVYWGCYRNLGGLPQLLAPERVCAPEAVTLPSAPTRWRAAGSGWGYRERMPEPVRRACGQADREPVPDARQVAVLAVEQFRRQGGVPAGKAQPVYLRDEITWKKLPGRD